MRRFALACILSILIVLSLPIAGLVLGPALRDPLGLSLPMVLLVTVAFYGGVLLVWRIRSHRRSRTTSRTHVRTWAKTGPFGRRSRREPPITSP